MHQDNEQNESRVLSRHCPQLGHPIPFSYCLRARMNEAGEAKPCRKIINCWWETFDIVRFLQDTMSEADFLELTDPAPKDRTAGLMDAIGKAVDGLDKK